MKKILLTSAIIASVLTSFAQTPAVPNGGFESWYTFKPCPTIDSLNGYVTLDETVYSDKNYCNPGPIAVKTTDNHSGSYALQLKPFYYGVYYGSFVFSGLSSKSADIGNGVPFTGRPTKLIGYYKFTKGGTDTLSISVELDDNNGNPVGYGDVTITTTQSSYAIFEITINYDPTFLNNPSILLMEFGIGSKNGTANQNTTAFLDDLSFVYGTTTATINYTTTSPINVYAANKNINFSDNVSDIHVIDMVGAQKMQETATTKTLNVAALTTGLYIVTYKYNDAYFSKKVVIE